MSYDVNKRPQNEDDFIRYFYALINRDMGSFANDYKAVLAKHYPWGSLMLQIPMNVPGAGEQLPPNAPFYGLTQQTDPVGIPKGRIWIPAAVPDNGVWYTRNIQYLADLPGGVNGIDFYWTWDYVSGNAYVPLGGSDSGGGTNPNPIPPDVEDRLIALETAYLLLEERVTALENKPSTGVQFGDKIALRTNSGMIAGIQGGGPTQVDAPIHLIGKKNIDSWESFELEKGQ